MEDQTEKRFYTREELQEFEEIITGKLEVSRKEYKELALELKENAGGNTDSEYGVDSQEKEQIEIMMARQGRFIDNLEKALIRIKNGTYGICKISGELIPKDRLKAVPHTTTTVEAKLKQRENPGQ